MIEEFGKTIWLNINLDTEMRSLRCKFALIANMTPSKLALILPLMTLGTGLPHITKTKITSNNQVMTSNS